jgi:hypothetical protein
MTDAQLVAVLLLWRCISKSGGGGYGKDGDSFLFVTASRDTIST